MPLTPRVRFLTLTLVCWGAWAQVRHAFSRFQHDSSFQYKSLPESRHRKWNWHADDHTRNVHHKDKETLFYSAML